jgi:hypothetical protein
MTLSLLDVAKAKASRISITLETSQKYSALAGNARLLYAFKHLSLSITNEPTPAIVDDLS